MTRPRQPGSKRKSRPGVNMDIIGGFFEPGLYVGIDYLSGEFTVGVGWAFFHDRWHVTFHVPFLCLHVKYDFDEYVIRRSRVKVTGTEAT